MSSPASTSPPAQAPAPPRRRGMSGTAKSMVISMLVLLGGCLILVALVPRIKSVQPPTANIASIARTVSTSQKWDVAVAQGLPEGWNPTNVTLLSGTPQTWQAGYTTPDSNYAAVVQTRGGDAAWVARQTGAVRRAGTVTIGGLTWTRYERNDGDQRSLVRPTPLAGLSTVVIGTAPWSQIDRFAGTLRPLSTSSLRSTR